MKINTNKTVYKHPALFQKKNQYGTGVYTRKRIPGNTIILKERPYLCKDPFDDEYIFRMIKYHLTHCRSDFLNLVPLQLDDTTDLDYAMIEKQHHAHFPELSKEDMILYYYKYKRNAFTFEDKSVLLYYATKMNHSCCSNVTYYEEGNHMIFQTKRPILANEELFDSYIGCNECKSERQVKLKKRYGFDCTCEKCANEV